VPWINKFENVGAGLIRASQLTGKDYGVTGINLMITLGEIEDGFYFK
jgi:hypothetical protein